MKNKTDTNTHSENHLEKTPLKAIRKYCLECCLEKPSEVRLCASKNCPLWHFRMGKNPSSERNFTKPQERDVTGRFAKARAPST